MPPHARSTSRRAASPSRSAWSWPSIAELTFFSFGLKHGAPVSCSMATATPLYALAAFSGLKRAETTLRPSCVKAPSSVSASGNSAAPSVPHAPIARCRFRSPKGVGTCCCDTGMDSIRQPCWLMRRGTLRTWSRYIRASCARMGGAQSRRHCSGTCARSTTRSCGTKRRGETSQPYLLANASRMCLCGPR